MSRGVSSAIRQSPFVILLVATLCGGCSHYIDPNVPEPIRPFSDPEFDNPYLLYLPSNYDRAFTWPLVVVCHPSLPGSPDRTIRDWTQAAERTGFLVAVPRLFGTRRFFERRVDRRLAKLRGDERVILSTVRHIRAGHTISDDRIFIHGASAGAYAALYTGVRHPDLFRAVSLAQPGFDEPLMEADAPAIDPFQPIHVQYDLSDAVSGKGARRCLEWLRRRGFGLITTVTAAHPVVDVEGPVAFFEEIVRTTPWIHILARPAEEGGPLTVRFKLKGSMPAGRIHWAFGDGGDSPDAEPEHRYAGSGTYRVTVSLTDAHGTTHRRAIDLRLPEFDVVAVQPGGRMGE